LKKKREISDIKKIGEGGYAIVYKANYNGMEVAVKEIRMSPDVEEDNPGEIESIYAEFRREAYLMSILSHPHLIKLYGVCVKPACMVMELMNMGNLFDYLHSSPPLDWSVRYKFLFQIVSAIDYLHGLTPTVVHRDLKTPNILLNKDKDGIITLKVADIGASAILGLVQNLQKRTVFNPVWLAPEIMRKEKYDEKIDIYAIGIMMWEILTQKNLFTDLNFMSEIERFVFEGNRPTIPNDCPPGYKIIMCLCWDDDPFLRPAAKDLTPLVTELQTNNGKEFSALKSYQEKVATLKAQEHEVLKLAKKRN